MSRLKGKVPFTVEWEDGSEDFVLLLDWNALCVLDEKIPGIVSGQVDLQRPNAVRLVMWAALQAMHPGTTEAEAGDIISAYGAGRVADLLGEAFSAAFPEGAGKSTGNPRSSGSKKP